MSWFDFTLTRVIGAGRVQTLTLAVFDYFSAEIYDWHVRAPVVVTLPAVALAINPALLRPSLRGVHCHERPQHHDHLSRGAGLMQDFRCKTQCSRQWISGLRAVKCWPCWAVPARARRRYCASSLALKWLTKDGSTSRDARRSSCCLTRVAQFTSIRSLGYFRILDVFENIAFGLEATRLQATRYRA